MAVARGEREGSTELWFNRHKISVIQDDQFLEICCTMSVSSLELHYCTVYLKFCQEARSHVKCSYQNKKEKSLPSWRLHSGGEGTVVIGATKERKGKGIGERQGGVQFYIGCWRRLG